MRYIKPRYKAAELKGKPTKLEEFLREESGVTAIEFGMVALPFFMFAFGVIGIGLHFFTQNSLDHAVSSAARKIRTGQAQKAGTTVAEFKQMVKDEAGPTIDSSKLQIHMMTADNWDEITPPSCLDGAGQQVSGTGEDADAVGDHSGGAGKVVMVTACYEWEMAKLIPFLKLGTMSNGSGLIQAATTFRTEPYE